MPRVSITSQQKLLIIRDADERQSNGETLMAIAKSHEIQPVQIQKLEEAEKQFDGDKAKGTFSPQGTAFFN
jgi:hypothetical protein